ncbi:MAG: signal recognition particle receptor subunit alpha, partial [Rhabdaerophilum sp.]
MTSPPENEKKPGFFSRLFGGGKAPVPAGETAVELVQATTEESTASPDSNIAQTPSSAQLVAAAVPAPPTLGAIEPPPKLSWWKRLSQGLSRTASSLGSGITSIFTQRKLDADTLQDLEDILIQADLGVEVSGRIVATIGKDRFDKTIAPEEIKTALASEVEKVLAPVAQPLVIDKTKKPFVILMVGVNGSGKTTTIGKLAAKFRAEGQSVMIAAGDTFRAAAIEQLQVW